MNVRSFHASARGCARTLASVAALLGAVSVLTAAHPAGAQTSPNVQNGFTVTTLSTPADMVTGGDVLVRVDVPAGTDLGSVAIRVNGVDVTGAFLASPTGSLTGLVTGLREGSNRLEVTAKENGKGATKAQLTLLNHSIKGPVFSGPQEQPFYCQTHQFNLPVIGGNLGQPIDEDCSINTRVDYFYRNTANQFRPWPAGATTYPADVAETTNTLGVTVKYIVRMETGTINRGIYQTTILHDPIAEPTPTWYRRPAGWNGRLIYTFGGGCTNGWYRQGNSTGGVTDNFMLSNGYAVASSSLNVFGNNCQEVTAAETMMMVKERFIEAYGPVAHTQGFGCSGGSYQQHQIADNYPGLLDGIIPGCSFPEVGFATIMFITDDWLIQNYMENLASVEWTYEQKRAVTGHLLYETAPNVANGARRIDPRVFCGVVPVAERYDPVTNPDGVRCDVYDHTVNAYGTDPTTGFARRPLDNVGVQYGLKALNDGVISKAQFLDLNEKIGGFDHDANIVPTRSEGDPIAIRAAYATGRLTYGGLGLAETPIIDYRGYQDDTPGGDIHVRYHSFSMRERIRKANGHADNHVMLHEHRGSFGGYSTASPLLRRAILTMDRWITAINADTAPGTKAEKVVRNKPADLVEGCMTRDGSAFIEEEQTRDPSSTCEQLYPSMSFPREVAGGPITADVIKCHLKPLDPADYAVEFTAAEWERLRSIFPTGVCDWSKPGFQQKPPAGTWISYGNGKDR